jgi:hypothetical protein
VEKWAADGADAQRMMRAAAGSTRRYVDDIIRRYQRYTAQQQ